MVALVKHTRGYTLGHINHYTVHMLLVHSPADESVLEVALFQNTQL